MRLKSKSVLVLFSNYIQYLLREECKNNVAICLEVPKALSSDLRLEAFLRGVHITR